MTGFALTFEDAHVGCTQTHESAREAWDEYERQMRSGVWLACRIEVYPLAHSEFSLVLTPHDLQEWSYAEGEQEPTRPHT